MTLPDVLPAIRQLSSSEKIRLIRILAEEFDRNNESALFEQGKEYHLPTPYNSYGAAQILADALANSDLGRE